MTNAEIEAFLAVAEHKSISKAAEVLFINQSSLSTKIKTLAFYKSQRQPRHSPY